MISRQDAKESIGLFVKAIYGHGNRNVNDRPACFVFGHPFSSLGALGVLARALASSSNPECHCAPGLPRAYLAAINAKVMSSMRLEKPDSLSYQLSTLTRLPSITRVWLAS